MKPFMIMAAFGIGFASVATTHASEMTPHAIKITSAQQEHQVTFPMPDGPKQPQTDHATK